MKYLLDANVFMAANNLHYGMEFCPAFWDWLIVGNARRKVFSIEKVGDEISAGDDALTGWAEGPGKHLLEVLKREKLVLDWRKIQRPRAAVRISIEDVLDESLPESFSQELFQQKVETVYQHVFDSYYGGGRGVYATAA